MRALFKVLLYSLIAFLPGAMAAGDSVPAGEPGTSTSKEILAKTHNSAAAAAESLGGRFPGGQSLLFQGAWTDPVTGLALHRERWYDQRTGAWLSEDPMGNLDSPSLYSFVGWGPHSRTDPLGLFEKGSGFDQEIEEQCRNNPGCLCQDATCGSLSSLLVAAYGGPLTAGVAEATMNLVAYIKTFCIFHPLTCTELAVGAAETIADVPNPISALPIVSAEKQFAQAFKGEAKILQAPAAFVGRESGSLTARSVPIVEQIEPLHGQFFSAHEDGEAGVAAHLSRTGILSLYIKTGPRTPRGSDMFNEALQAFAGQVEGIKGIWLADPGLSDNYHAYRAARNQGLSAEAAAFQTFTGKMAHRAGFTKARLITDRIDKVEVEFTR